MASVEYQHFTIPVDTNVQQEIERLIKEGWTPVPGVAPLAIYHMQRVVDHMAAAGVQIGLSVKDEGITIIRGNGKN